MPYGRGHLADPQRRLAQRRCQQQVLPIGPPLLGGPPEFGDSSEGVGVVHAGDIRVLLDLRPVDRFDLVLAERAAKHDAIAVDPCRDHHAPQRHEVPRERLVGERCRILGGDVVAK